MMRALLFLTMTKLLNGAKLTMVHYITSLASLTMNHIPSQKNC